MAAPTTRFLVAAGVTAALGLSFVAPVAPAAAAPDAAHNRSAAAAGAAGTLKVKLIGLPEPVKAVKVKGPKQFKATLTKTTKLKKLQPGTYKITAKKKVSSEFTSYRPETRKQKVRVRPGKTAKVKVVFRDVFDDGGAQEEPIVVAPPSTPPQPGSPVPGPSPQPQQAPTSPPPSSSPPSSPPPSSPPPSSPPDDPPASSPPLRDLAAGDSHSCVATHVGELYCWGSNDKGQLGDGTKVDSERPRKVLGISGALAVAAGTGSTCAIVAFGEARCWGGNSDGQLGDGTGGDGTALHDSSAPVTVVDANGTPLRGLSDIAVGGSHACAIGTKPGGKKADATGVVWCWGANNRGQVGTGQAGPSVSSAIRVKGVPRPTDIDAGYDYNCVLLGSARIACWGANDEGQLGNGTLTESDSPGLVPTSGRGALGLGVGDAHACASLVGDEVVCWGSNDEGQLDGQPDSPTGTASANPVPVSIAGIAAIRPGGFHTCALLKNDTVSCWGGNYVGQLGIGSTEPSPGIRGLAALTGVHELEAGSNHTCAASADGTVYCWGANNVGQVGVGIGIAVAAPREVPLP